MPAEDDKPQQQEGIIAQPPPEEHGPEHFRGTVFRKDQVKGPLRNAGIAGRRDQRHGGIDIDREEKRGEKGHRTAERPQHNKRQGTQRCPAEERQQQKRRQQALLPCDQAEALVELRQRPEDFIPRALVVPDHMEACPRFQQQFRRLRGGLRLEGECDLGAGHNGTASKPQIRRIADGAAARVGIEKECQDREEHGSELPCDEVRSRHGGAGTGRKPASAQPVNLKRLPSAAGRHEGVIVFSQSNGFKRALHGDRLSEKPQGQKAFGRFGAQHDGNAEDPQQKEPYAAFSQRKPFALPLPVEFPPGDPRHDQQVDHQEKKPPEGIGPLFLCFHRLVMPLSVFPVRVLFIIAQEPCRVNRKTGPSMPPAGESFLSNPVLTSPCGMP